MGNNKLAVKDKVQRYLTDWLGSVNIDSDGDFNFQYNSTHLWISVRDHGESVLVKVFANTNNKVSPTPALYEYVATEGAGNFGSLRCYRKDGFVRIFMEHSLLGDLLDPDELQNCVTMLAVSADRVDDEIRMRFGGNVYHNV